MLMSNVSALTLRNLEIRGCNCKVSLSGALNVGLENSL